MTDNVFPELQELKAHVAQSLAGAAATYYRTGVIEFLRVERKAWTTYQAAIGNLAISIELMLKAFVAYRCFRKLYASLPEPLDIALACEIPPQTLSLRPFENSLRSF